MQIMIIKDPEVAKLFADETRRHILHILRRHERSTTDLAKALKKSHSSIIHHLSLLKEAGLVEETRTEQVRNLVQTFYRSTAGRFMISYSLGETLNEEGETIPWQEGIVQYTMEGLSAFGIELSDEEQEHVRKLLTIFFLRDQKAFEETLEQQIIEESPRKSRMWETIRFLKQLRLSEDKEFNQVIGELKGILTPTSWARRE